jgi:hypothetical protein
MPSLFSPLWHCFTLLCFILRSPLPFNASIIFYCYLRFVFLSTHFVYIACLPCSFTFIYVCTVYSSFCFLPLYVLSCRFSSLSYSVFTLIRCISLFLFALLFFCSLRWHILVSLGSELIWGNGKSRRRAHCSPFGGHCKSLVSLHEISGNDWHSLYKCGSNPKNL